MFLDFILTSVDLSIYSVISHDHPVHQSNSSFHPSMRASKERQQDHHQQGDNAFDMFGTGTPLFFGRSGMVLPFSPYLEAFGSLGSDCVVHLGRGRCESLVVCASAFIYCCTVVCYIRVLPKPQFVLAHYCCCRSLFASSPCVHLCVLSICIYSNPATLISSNSLPSEPTVPCCTPLNRLIPRLN